MCLIVGKCIGFIARSTGREDCLCGGVFEGGRNAARLQQCRPGSGVQPSGWIGFGHGRPVTFWAEATPGSCRRFRYEERFQTLSHQQGINNQIDCYNKRDFLLLLTLFTTNLCLFVFFVLFRLVSKVLESPRISWMPQPRSCTRTKSTRYAMDPLLSRPLRPAPTQAIHPSCLVLVSSTSTIFITRWIYVK